MYFFLFFPVGTETKNERLPVGLILLTLLLVGFQLLDLARPDYHRELIRASYSPARPSISGAFLGLFLHGDWFHLLGNAIYLIVFGRQLESRLGAAPLLLLFAAGGIAACLVQGATTSPDAAGHVAHVIGASGSIAALLGFSLIRFPHRRVRIVWFLFTIVGGLAKAGSVHLHAFLACALWFVFQIAHGLVAWGNGGSSVAYAAHAGGFMAGVVASLMCGMAGQVRREIHRDRGFAYLQKGEWAAAAGELSTHLQLVPADHEAAIRRAQAYSFSGEVSAALNEYRRLLRESLRLRQFERCATLVREMGGRGYFSDLEAPAILKLAFELGRSGFAAEAVTLYEELAARYPRHSAADLALLRAGEILWEKLGRLEEASAVYSKLLALYPESEWRSIAEARSASMIALTGSRRAHLPTPRGGDGPPAPRARRDKASPHVRKWK